LAAVKCRYQVICYANIVGAKDFLPLPFPDTDTVIPEEILIGNPALNAENRIPDKGIRG
jgi:hypothetical protein